MACPQCFARLAKGLAQLLLWEDLSWIRILLFRYKRKFPPGSWNQSSLLVSRLCTVNRCFYFQGDIAFSRALLSETIKTFYRCLMVHKLRNDQMDFSQFFLVYRLPDLACNSKRQPRLISPLGLPPYCHSLDFQAQFDLVRGTNQVCLFFVFPHICSTLVSLSNWALLLFHYHLLSLGL